MHNPIRRSKKIGLTQGGRVKAGTPMEKWSRLFSPDTWEILSKQNLPKWNVIKENPSRSYYHPCTAEEIHFILKKLPEDFTEDINAIVLKRLTKRDEEYGVEARKRWHIIILNSFPKTNLLEWEKPPTIDQRKHFQVWSSNWIKKNRKWYLKWTKEQVKRYYLYHLLLHEIGHFNDYIYGRWFFNSLTSISSIILPLVQAYWIQKMSLSQSTEQYRLPECDKCNMLYTIFLAADRLLFLPLLLISLMVVVFQKRPGI